MGTNLQRRWIALVTFERTSAPQDILPDCAQGACGWMLALARSEDQARRLLIDDIAVVGLRVVEVDKLATVADAEDLRELDDHLAANADEIEPGKCTVWGTIHGYKGEGEA